MHVPCEQARIKNWQQRSRLVTSSILSEMAPSRSRTDSLRNSAYSSKRHSSPGPHNARSPSPTFSETTHASHMNFGIDGPSKIITRADLKASVQAYERVRTIYD